MSQRIIKFRAIDKKTNDWVVGYYSDNAHIYNVDKGLRVEIKKDTVCQFTGLLDKNGVEIYEGDILDCKCTSLFKNHGGVSEVGFANHEWKARYLISSCPIKDALGFNWGGWESFEVIGNIYQTPKFLKQYES